MENTAFYPDVYGLINIKDTLVQIEEALNLHSEDVDVQQAARTVAVNLEQMVEGLHGIHEDLEAVIKHVI